MELTTHVRHLSDVHLAAEVARLARHERAASADLVACLAEFDRRRIYLAQGFTSVYAYCREQLHLTDGAAYRRIETARASRRFPVLVDMLRDGRLSLATASLIASRLTPANVQDVLSQATHKSKREVELLVAKLNPQSPVPSVIRKLPEPRRVEPPHADASRQVAPPPPSASHTSSLIPPQSRRPVVAPLSECHYKLQVTIGAPAHARLRNIQDLMRHTLPNGDPAAIVERALEMLEQELLKKKAAEVARPRVVAGSRTGAGGGAGAGARNASKGRHIPASVKRAVWRRDAGCCAFSSDDGKRCGERGALEYHHVDPFAHGGEATAANLELRCRAHNGFEWERDVSERLAGAGV